VKKSLLCSMLVSASCLAFNVQAATITLSGSTNNSFFDVVYDNSLVNLFGTPQLLNNVVFFTPGNFVAKTDGVSTSDVVTSTVNFRLVPLAGYAFNSFTFQERGDFQLSGIGSAVNAAGQITFTAASQSLIRGFQGVTADLPSPQTSLTALGSTSAYHELDETSNWRADLSLNSTDFGALPQAGVIDVSIRNDLSASAGQSADGFEPFAFIEKKFVGGSSLLVGVTPIPEPASFELFMLGVGVLVARKRASRA
jgi:hypothetical protein